MTILGQDWLCDDRNKYYLGLQRTLFLRRITKLSQDWSCTDNGIQILRMDSICLFRSITFLSQDWLWQLWFHDHSAPRLVMQLGAKALCRP